MNKLLEFAGLFVTKLLGVVTAIVGLTYTGITWHQNELEAMEIKVTKQIEKRIDLDMANLNKRLDDINQGVRDIRNHLMRREK